MDALMLLMVLLTTAVVQRAGSSATLQRVDEPIPLLQVSSVAGYLAKLPCDLKPEARNIEALMVFWYKSDNEAAPIYSVDGRGKILTQGKHWSNPNVLADRAKLKINAHWAELHIDRLMPEDAGMYKCRIDFKNRPTRNQRVNLTVIVPPQSPVIYTTGRTLAKNLQPFDEGSELTLICEVTGGTPPPTVTWHRDGQLIDETFVRDYDDITVNRLDLNRVSRDLLSAQLVCMASNTRLVQPATAEIIIDVNLKPLLVNITNKTPHLSALKTYEIECVSWGSRPEAVITWWKGTHLVKDMARNFIEGPNMTRSVMSYVPTIEDDNKFLTCRAENPVVSDSALEDRWHLIVHYVPVVTIKLGSSLRATDINEGDDVYFECEVKANPKAYKLAWFKDGKELHHDPSANVKIPGGNSLVLQKVTRASAGEYSCMAANYEGKATSRSVTLEVMYAPVCKDGTTTQVVGALKHETISLVCGVQSKPPPTSFQWTFNNSGELMNVPASRFTLIRPQHLVTNHWHGSRLNYTPASDMDYGTIACLATNPIGSQKVPCLFQIIVAGKPYPLQNCTAVQSTGSSAYRTGPDDYKAADTRDWLIVRCFEGFDGGLPVTSYELEVYSDESVYHVNTIYINHTQDKSGLQVPGPVFEVPGLEPGRNYKLLLYAINAKGRSDPVVLEPITLKGVAMYTTGRSAASYASDYGLLVACFAGGITAVCILAVGVTLTLHRRHGQLGSDAKSRTHSVRYNSADGEDADVKCTARQEEPRANDVALREQQIIQLTQQVRQQCELQRLSSQYLVQPHPNHNPFLETSTSTVSSSTYPNYRELVEQSTPDDDPDLIPSGRVELRPDIFEPQAVERIRDFRRRLQEEDETIFLQKKDSWLRQNGSCQLIEEQMHAVGTRSDSPGAHDVYTRSSKVQESCI